MRAPVVGLACLLFIIIVVGSRPTHDPAQLSRKSHAKAASEAIEMRSSQHVSSVSRDASTLAASRSIARNVWRVVKPRDRDLDALAVRLSQIEKDPPRGSELIALRVDLERLIRARPDLAPMVARAFDAISDRGTLFVLSRALALCLDDASVRSTLLEDARSSADEARREMALRALSGSADPRVVAIEQTTFADASAPESVRSAAADGLARDFDRLDPTAAASARENARTLASTGSDLAARESALHLIAVATPGVEDAFLARRLLDDASTPPRIALAAARVALASGEERGIVARALAGVSSGPLDLRGRAAARLARENGGERD